MLTRLFFVLGLSLMAHLSLFAQGINFVQGNFEQALQQAQRENKLVFFDAYASWCGPCIRMANTTFKNARVGEFMNQHFVSIKVDMEKGEGRELARRYPVRAYPTLFFLDAQGNVIQQNVGGQSNESLLKIAEEARQKGRANTRNQRNTANARKQQRQQG